MTSVGTGLLGDSHEKARAVKIKHDKTADAAYVDLTANGVGPGGVARTIKVTEEINLDLDEQGRLVGIEILEASRILPPQ